jgi:UV DNA damage repair endonuclease
MAKGVKGFTRGNSGKPKGAINKNTKSVKEAFVEAFGKLQLKQGVNLADWGQENPTEFYRLCTKLIPQAVDATVTMKKLGTDLEQELYTNE